MRKAERRMQSWEYGMMDFYNFNLNCPFCRNRFKKYFFLPYRGLIFAPEEKIMNNKLHMHHHHTCLNG